MSSHVNPRKHRSHGDGRFSPEQLARCGEDCVFEDDALIFHPESVHLGRNVYLGHQAILKGYYKNSLHIGDGSWIGQQCFLHAAGGLRIGARVGIGPGAKILTSQHRKPLDIGSQNAVADEPAVLDWPLEFQPVAVGEGADIGAGAIVLPGVTIGARAIVAAGAVVTRDIPPGQTWAGVPARALAEVETGND